MFIQVKRSDTVEMVLERSHTERIVLYGVAIAVPIFFGAMLWQIAVSSGVGGKVNWAVMSPTNVMWWIVIALEALILWFAGPHYLRLNFQQNVYHARTGPLFTPRSYSGSFADFYGLCIRPVYNKRMSQVGYRVDLDWKVAHRAPFDLGSFTTLQKAQERQRLLSVRMGNLPTGNES